jgi:hypothetical protein
MDQPALGIIRSLSWRAGSARENGLDDGTFAARAPFTATLWGDYRHIGACPDQNKDRAGASLGARQNESSGG